MDFYQRSNWQRGFLELIFLLIVILKGRQLFKDYWAKWKMEECYLMVKFFLLNNKNFIRVQFGR